MRFSATHFHACFPAPTNLRGYRGSPRSTPMASAKDSSHSFAVKDSDFMAASWNLLRQARFGPLLFCLLLAGACSRTSVSSVATTAAAGSSSDVELFHDVTAETGIDFTYQNGEESKR